MVDIVTEGQCGQVAAMRSRIEVLTESQKPSLTRLYHLRNAARRAIE
jgi:hypothetical protein